MTSTLTKSGKAFEAMEAAFRSIPARAWVVVDSEGGLVARILEKHSRTGGRVTVFVTTTSADDKGQRVTFKGTANGYGYDKLAGALDGIPIRDRKGNAVVFQDHGRGNGGPSDPSKIYPDLHHGWRAHTVIW